MKNIQNRTANSGLAQWRLQSSSYDSSLVGSSALFRLNFLLKIHHYAKPQNVGVIKSIMKQLKVLLIISLTLLSFYGRSQDTTYKLHHVHYPQQAIDLELQGIVYVSFDIDSTCSIHNIIIEHSLCKECDTVLINDIIEEERFLKRENNSKCKSRAIKCPVKYQLTK